MRGQWDECLWMNETSMTWMFMMNETSMTWMIMNEWGFHDMKLFDWIRLQWYECLWIDETLMTWVFINVWDVNDINVKEWMRC